MCKIGFQLIKLQVILTATERAEAVANLLHFPIGADQCFGVRGAGNPTVVKVGDHLWEKVTGHERNNLFEMFRRREG